MRSKRILFFIEIAILTALALILDLIPFLQFKLWPAGGSISLAMIPVYLVAFRWGIKGGLLSGFLWGILQIAAGDAYIVNFWQGLIEYGLAFTVIGFAGIFASQIQSSIKNKKEKKALGFITSGVVVGGMMRFFMHFIAGVIFFSEAAPEGQPAWLYSLIYNSSYIIPCMIISTIAIYYLFNKQPFTLLKTAQT